MSVEQPYCAICVECDKRPVVPPSVIYCAQCAPADIAKAASEAAEEAYYLQHPDQRSSSFADDPGSVGGI